MLRKHIFEIIEPAANEETKASKAYDIFMLISIIASMVPLAVKSSSTIFSIIDYLTVAIFILDYILRLLTADYKVKKGAKSFLVYPLTPMAIIDLLSILPSFIALSSGFKVLRLVRMIRTLRVFRSLKIFRYSKNIDRIIRVLKKEARPLGAVMSLAVFYVIFTALVMFNIEPETFNNFFEAVYWSAISLTLSLIHI